MKTIFFGTTKDQQETLEQLLPDVEKTFFEKSIAEDYKEKAEDAEIICTFVGSKITKEVIDLFPNLKLITTRSTGFDHIDTEYAKSKNIIVENVPAYGAHTVAEFTFALMFALARKPAKAYRKLRGAESYEIKDFEGFDLFGKTLGVVGTGKIGKNVIRGAKGFGMKVIAYDPYPNEKLASEIGYTYHSLEEVLKKADILTIHAPYRKETHHLINKDNIGLLKEGSRIINTARGEIIETEALLSALETGKVAGAALDVLEGERDMQKSHTDFLHHPERTAHFKLLLENHALIDSDKVIVTPHIAFCTQGARKRIIETTMENIRAFQKGTIQNQVS